MSKIDELEAPLRKYHEGKKITFQACVDAIRQMPFHPLHSIAVEYNRAMHEMQQSWNTWK